MTNSFDDICKEVIALSDIIHKQDFRACFIKHFSIKIKELNETSSEVDDKILQRLQSKLLEPLKYHLGISKNSSDKCLLIECLTYVIKLTLINNVFEFFDLYTLVFFQIYKGANFCHQQSEELKISVLEFCSLLMKNLTSNVREKVYVEENGAKFSLGVSIAVSIVKEERSIKLRISGLDFLLAASKFGKNPKYNVGIYKKIGDLFALYLPGIIAPLLEVALRNETQHHSITVKALSCWGHVLCLVLSDFSSAENLSENEIMKQWLEIPKKPDEKIVDVEKVLKGTKRTQSWLEAAAIAVQPVIEKILEIRKHSHVQCRLELTRVMVKLLKNCARTLTNSLTPIIEVLVSSTVDEDNEVCQVAEEALSEFEAKCGEKSVKIFVSVIEENLFSLITKLPGIIQSGNEKLTLSSFKSFSGYLKILGRLNRLQQLLSLSSTLKKLLAVIQMCFELETYPDISNQDFSIWDNDPNSNIWSKQWKRFRHFADDSIKSQLEDICRTLGKFGPTETLFDFLLDNYKEEYRSAKELLLIINEVVLGSEDIPDHVVKELIDFYLEPKNLRLALQVDEVNCTCLREAQCNIIKVALIMEGVGKLAKSLGKRFEVYLLETLYYVLEGMGNSYAIIRDSAKISGVEIANACGLNGSISSLIQKNVDYLTYHITIKLKRNDSGVFNVVTVLMTNSPFETMPNLEEILNSVLKSSSQNFDSPHTISYLRLFQTFVHCVNNWTKTSEKKAADTQSKTYKEIQTDLLMDYFKRLQKEPEEEIIEEEIKPEETADEEIPEEPKTPQLPRHLKMTLSISNHCLHYLPSKDKDKKLITLEILNECVWILADYEDELLPLVHKIWSPLVTRFEQISDPLIISRSFTLLCTLAHTSRYFIRSRTLKNVLPALQSFLIKEAPKSKLKSSSSGYFFTQAFKLQRELLENLGKLTSSLELFERQTDLVVESALPYLSSYQPRELQEKCRKLFHDLISYDPYLVWFKLHNLVENPEYASNAKSILESIK